MRKITNQFVGWIAALAIFTVIGCNSNKGTKSPDSSRAGQPPTQQVQPSPPLSPKILTKDAEYISLLNPPTGENLLAHSAAYEQKKQEIESKLTAIHDTDLRQRASLEEWSKVDKASLQRQAEATIRSAMQAFFLKHRGDWFEVGHVEFVGTNDLRLTSIEASPVELDGYPTIPTDVSTMDGVYAKFRELTKSQAEIAARAWMDEQSCAGILPRACANLGGTPAECSDPAKLREIEDSLPGVLNVDCKVNPSAEEGMDIAEKKMRSERLVLVGQGDLVEHRIDKLMLVDYDTETVLLNIDPKALAGKVGWKFSCSQGANCSNTNPPVTDASVGEGSQANVIPSDQPPHLQSQSRMLWILG